MRPNNFVSLFVALVLMLLIVTGARAVPIGVKGQEPAVAQTAQPASSRKPRPRKRPAAPARNAEAQLRLRDLGYWVGTPDGMWGTSSRHALIAFQKVERRKRTGRLTGAELAALRKASPPAPREQGVAHVEVDLDRQVLFVVEADGTVSRILPVSTGNGKTFMIEGETAIAVTPLGRFRVYRKLEGWRKSKLGMLYYPSYILGGIAIHGNPSVPAQPASHGCIRIPMFAAEELSRITPIGTEVVVYGGATASAKSVSQTP